MKKKDFLLIFAFSFLVVSIIFGLRGKLFYFIDGGMWSQQALYFNVGDDRQFDFERGYGHPGGPIIEGLIFFHKLFKIPYLHPDNLLIIFISIINGLIIAGTCVLSFLITGNKFWWPVILSTLSINILYDFATPPTMVAVPLVVFLTLLTLYLNKIKDNLNIYHLILWSFFCGLLIATRADIGIFYSLFLVIFLMRILNWKDLLLIIFGVFIFFFIFDPYMWYMPIQHIKDLIYKIVFHYSDISTQHISIYRIFSLSVFAFLSVLSLIFIIFFKKYKIKNPLPISFSYILLFMTLVFYVIMFTSNIRTERYFHPIISIWEVFIPLFIFSFLEKVYPSCSIEKKQKLVIILLIGFQIIYTFFLYIIYFIKIKN